MRGKVISFELSLVNSLKIVDERAEKREYISALTMLNDLAAKNPQNTKIIQRKADIYCKMGLTDLSDQQYFNIVNIRKNDQEAYFGLGRNCLAKSEFSLAEYYFSKVDEIREDEIDWAMEFADRQRDDEAGYRLVYPMSKSVATNIKAYAKQVLSIGDVVKYRIMNQDVIKNFPNDCEALNNLALANMIGGRLDEAEKFCKQVIELNPNDVIANCNLVLIYKDLEDDVNLNKAIHNIDTLVTKDVDEVYRIATTFCYCGQHDNANARFSWVRQSGQYTIDGEILFATSCYNIKKYKLAHDTVVDLLIVDGKNEYVKYLVELMSDYDKPFIPRQILEYRLTLPEDIYSQRVLKLLSISDYSQMTSKVKDDIEWGLKNIGIKYAEKCLPRISMLGEEVVEFYRQLLVNISISSEIKSMILVELLTIIKFGKINIVNSGCFITLNIPRDYPQKLSNSLFVAISKLSFEYLETDNYIKKLIKAAWIVDDTIQERRVVNFLESGNALSALLVLLSKVKFVSNEDINHLFHVEAMDVAEKWNDTIKDMK